jgi:competence protein ComEA
MKVPSFLSHMLSVVRAAAFWLRESLLAAEHKKGALLRGGVRLAMVACVLAVLAWFGGRARVGEARAGPASVAPASVAPASVAPVAPLPMAVVPAGVAASLDAGPAARINAAPEVAREPPSARGSPASHGEASPEHPVYLNDATDQDLRRLPGIGAKRAAAILALRAKLGRFRKVEELMRVRGIGRKGIERLRPVVRLDPPQIADAGAP